MAKKVISKLEQFSHENHTWQRMLDFFREENAYLKNRLSEVVDHKTGDEFLLLAEHYQNQFINKDECIALLKKDISEVNADLQEELKKQKKDPENSFESRHIKIRNEIEYFERNFSQLKNEFNKYLVSIL